MPSFNSGQKMTEVDDDDNSDYIDCLDNIGCTIKVNQEDIDAQ